MADLSTSAVDLPIATDDHDAAADPASDAGESSGDASAAADVLASDTSSSAAPASLSSDTAVAGTQQGDGPTVLTAPAMTQDEIAAATAAIVLAPAALMPLEADPTPAVSIDVEDHAEARERFAGLMARLHGVEEDFVHALRNELNAIGTLLHLHSVASGKADATGDYSSSDLS
ncbi:hypothetical protein WK15_11710 [Burkholderia ubonensis]|nr:hypothetical protein [Burkholderia ubonensis]KVR27823.1 hypothetical protein WK15_11710 [Burkholderia ubonensis]KWB93984.1 hypothetical protein WL45_15725 [Burkholderia ubonensis]KWC17441.1 hypothetical protein WL46_26620 [Burkholderia ubonensis]